MIKPENELRVILIGGSSHVGKSTLARSLRPRLGWGHISTDSLARHPGRPWRKDLQAVPKQVADHYLSLSVDELFADVLRHYRSMWRDIEAMIISHATDTSTERLIFEGSALWPESVQAVPKQVADHYLSLSVDELFADVLRHYRSMWRDIEAMIISHATDTSTERLIFEGSALWPESVATLDVDKVAAIWLTAGNDLFRTRIHNESHFEDAAAGEKKLIQKFLERTQLYNERMNNAANRLGLAILDVEATSSIKELSDKYLKLANSKPTRMITSSPFQRPFSQGF